MNPTIISRVVRLLTMVLGAFFAFGTATLHAGGSSAGLYRITMSSPSFEGLVTDCATNPSNYVVGHWDTNHLTVNGTDLDGTQPSAIYLDFFVDPTRAPVSWTRKYDVGHGLSGVFNSCYGQTPFNNGNLFLYFSSKGGHSTIKFTWWYDYYTSATVREHFGVMTGEIPFPAWTGGTISGRVTGKFDDVYYLKENGKVVASYVSLTNGVGRYFDFTLTIEKIP